MLGPWSLASGLRSPWQLPQADGGGGRGVLLAAVETLAWPEWVPHVWAAVCLLGVMEGCGVKANCLGNYLLVWKRQFFL